jgi:hypothetical protein
MEDVTGKNGVLLLMIRLINGKPLLELEAMA